VLLCGLEFKEVSVNLTENVTDSFSVFLLIFFLLFFLFCVAVEDALDYFFSKVHFKNFHNLSKEDKVSLSSNII